MNHQLTLSRSYRSACEPTPNVLAIAQMFGIGADQEHEVVLYKDLKVTVGPRRVIYITGESGAGKTSLLRDIKAECIARDLHVLQLRDVNSLPDKPVIDLFETLSLQKALELLTYSGLSEPFVVLRKPKELSDGQRYRLGLALAMLDAQWLAHPLIFMDEFLANLDRETARAVAYQTRKVASKTEICFVVATTHRDIAEDLNANCTVSMKLGKSPEVTRRIA